MKTSNITIRIDPAINETGICFPFDTEDDAKAYIAGFGK